MQIDILQSNTFEYTQAFQLYSIFRKFYNAITTICWRVSSLFKDMGNYIILYNKDSNHKQTGTMGGHDDYIIRVF